jgi:hypothetical protein
LWLGLDKWTSYRKACGNAISREFRIETRAQIQRFARAFSTRAEEAAPETATDGDLDSMTVLG